MPTIRERISGAMNSWAGTAQPATTNAPTPAPTNSQMVASGPDTNAVATPAPGATEIVEGTFVENSPAAGGVMPVNIHDAFSHTENFRKVVEQFDEDKQTPLEWVVQKFFTFVAYVLPTLIAWFVGVAIGDAFSAKFNAGDAYNVFAHVLSVSLELALVMLCLACVVVFKRALKDRSQVGMLIGLAIVFLLCSILNSFAQLFLLEKHITLSASNIVPMVAVVFRSFASMLIDIICAIYLGVTGVRSLKKYLQDKRSQIEAVKDVNAVEIEMGETRMRAAMNMQQSMMDMQSKAQRASTWNEIESLQSKAMIEQARKNMRDAGGEGGSYRRNRY